jgi:hypothetical protein
MYIQILVYQTLLSWSYYVIHYGHTSFVCYYCYCGLFLYFFEELSISIDFVYVKFNRTSRIFIAAKYFVILDLQTVFLSRTQLVGVFIICMQNLIFLDIVNKY